ncbi:MAG: hypothetical protein H0V09_07125 [Gemmatimonadetes bacterium]|nr:hypothetical protein [Gemmatimonadota bacterium]
MTEYDSLMVRTTCHFEPIQFLFDPMKGIIADLVVGTHVENSPPRRLESSAMDFAVCGVRWHCPRHHPLVHMPAVP